MHVFITRTLPADPEAILGKHTFVVHEGDRAPTPEELVNGAAQAHAVVSLLSDAFDPAILDALPKLQVIANVAVGYNNIDVDAATQRGVWVTNTPDVLTEATADCTWGLLLAVARRLVEADRFVRRGAFQGWSPTMLLGTELAGRRLGIFGLGRIGQAVARRARAFGMETVYTTRSGVPDSVQRELGVRAVTKTELVETSDIISIHCPLTESTHHAFGKREFAAMKKSALLINTARGPIVNEEALARALHDGDIAGAGLDVYENEPEVHPDLLELDNVVLLPHIASATVDTRREMAEMALRNAAAVLDGQTPPPNAVNAV